MDSDLMSHLDTWLSSRSEREFLSVLPVMRRAFVSCERRATEQFANELLKHWRAGTVSRSKSPTLSQKLWGAVDVYYQDNPELFHLIHRLFPEAPH